MGMRGSSDDDARWLRRLAVQLVAQLPEEREEAIAVLRYAEDLLKNFVDREDQKAAPKLALVHALSEAGGKSLDANRKGSPDASPR
jgi:hypothetical protein